MCKQGKERETIRVLSMQMVSPDCCWHWMASFLPSSLGRVRSRRTWRPWWAAPPLDWLKAWMSRLTRALLLLPPPPPQRARSSRACVREGLYRLQLVPDENYAILRATTLSAEESHKFLIMVPSFIILAAPLVKLRYLVIQLPALAISWWF